MQTNELQLGGHDIKFAFQVTTPDGKVAQYVGRAVEGFMTVETNVDYDDVVSDWGTNHLQFASSVTTDMTLELKNIQMKVISKPGENNEASSPPSPEPF